MLLRYNLGADRYVFPVCRGRSIIRTHKVLVRAASGNISASAFIPGMDGLTLALVILSVAVFAASRVSGRGEGLRIFAAILSLASAVAVLSDAGSEDWQIVVSCVISTFTFLSSIFTEDKSRWPAA